MSFQSGEYPQPLLRNQFVQAPMVSGYVTIRLSAGDSFINTSGLDDTTLVQFENVSTSSTGSMVIQLQQTSDPSSSGLRTSIGGPVTLVPGGRKDQTYFPSQNFLEVTTVSGGGELRAQFTSRLAWNIMAFSKSDPFYPPQLWEVVGGSTWAQLVANTGS